MKLNNKIIKKLWQWFKKKKKRNIGFTVFGIILIFFWFSLPKPLFVEPTSTVLRDQNGELLGAKIAADGQWRFPETTHVPEKFAKAIVQFEDKHFYHHLGFNPVSMIRALYLNIRKGKVVSGGSTISMQVIRLSRKNKSRTVFEKLIETILAMRLELTYSKSEILRLYASHAPFGSNVVGIDAAAWRYFGVSADNLSWAEISTLAVLPNSPALIYPGKNHNKLFEKRNRLLNSLQKKGIIDNTTCSLSKNEVLPEKPFSLPQFSPHLLERAVNEGKIGQDILTTIDIHLQDKVNEIIALHHRVLQANEIHNAAALVLDVNTGNVLAYTANTPSETGNEHSNDVDIILAPRSTGSILKPYLYAAMLNDGLLLPTTLIPDIPMQIGGFVPENYNLTYDGAVPAKQALSRSLNIPAVKMLQSYGVEQFYALLKKMGMSTLTKSSSHYGLSLILGGAEARLWDLAGIYASMGRTLNHFSAYQGKYDKTDFHPPLYIKSESVVEKKVFSQSSYLDAASVWLALEAMVEVSRPDEELQWQQFSSSARVAWKTGTSFGNRDAWSIGITPDYVVAVWVGNASGEGRPGLTGLGCAAPILFDIFKVLKPRNWFLIPESEMVEIPVCRYSGYRASAICESPVKIKVPKKVLKTQVCPYHQIVHLDMSGNWQVTSNCESTDNMQHISWFVLPPVMEWYFKNKNPFYKVLPPFRADCAPTAESRSMEMIYPANNSKIYIPVDLDGKPGNTVFKLAVRNPQAIVFWHLDDKFIGSTTQFHQRAIAPEAGIHHLTLVDQKGENLSIKFEIMNKRNE
ncbi:MAG: penicillin-binding protein 1C [Bacteroidetes bacterium]|nr:penicillin-binding protein 1C [Bacteroidota bacterium]